MEGDHRELGDPSRGDSEAGVLGAITDTLAERLSDREAEAFGIAGGAHPVGESGEVLLNVRGGTRRRVE